MKTKKEFKQFAENAGREYAISFRDAFAKYSTRAYVSRFANARCTNWIDSLIEKGEDIPEKMKELCVKAFVNTFINNTMDYINNLPKSTNPHVINAMKKNN